MKRIATLIMAALASLAGAAESGLEWDAPTQNADGSAIEIALTYVVQWGEGEAYDNTDSTTNTTITVSHKQNKWISARVKAVNEVGAESEWSKVLVFAAKIKPLPPVNLRLKNPISSNGQ